MTATITLTAELARDLKYKCAPEDSGYEVVADFEIDTARWAVVYALVIKDADGKFWEGSYRYGTGDEGERPWEYDDAADFTEVVARPKIATEYVRPGSAAADASKDIPNNAYVNGDDGYKWLTCGLCDNSLIEVDAGTGFTALITAVTGHECAEDGK